MVFWKKWPILDTADPPSSIVSDGFPPCKKGIDFSFNTGAVTFPGRRFRPAWTFPANPVTVGGAPISEICEISYNCWVCGRSMALGGNQNQQYPLVNIQKAIEHGPVEIVDFPINSMVDLSSSLMLVRLPEGKPTIYD